MKKIQNALVSVFHKEKLEPVVEKLKQLGVTFYSTGGTQSYLESLGADVVSVESVTDYPSILGGRVKTLHPKIFGGILGRRDLDEDMAQMSKYEIPPIDLVIVDLYPFEETVASGAEEKDIIEKIDIGGISLIRAAAKNYKEVMIVPSQHHYPMLLDVLERDNGSTELEDRKQFARAAFGISAKYDTAIHNYFSKGSEELEIIASPSKKLRYGENPHQDGRFYGQLDSMFKQYHGKELSYNNLLDVDAAVNLMSDFQDGEPTFAILKHNNACGIATRNTLVAAYRDALAGDPVSAFGGILIANREIDEETAEEIHKLFCEVVIAPSYSSKALDILKGKKNRIILEQKETALPPNVVRTALNGYLVQDRDTAVDRIDEFNPVTRRKAEQSQLEDLAFASKLVKHTKSNAIVLAKGKQLLASGTGQTSRVDALKQAIEKARKFGFDLRGAVMASDAFFPFPDCVEIADNEGINAVIQPGGSIKDQLSIDYCDEHEMAMVFTGTRHFKH